MKTFAIILLAFIILSCDILTTRSPEDPSQARLDFTAPVSPELLFENLKKAFENKSLENYIHCIADNSYIEREFVFYPTAKSLTIDPKLAEWSVADEEQYFFNLIKANENNVVTLRLNNEEWNSIGEYRSYVYDYSIIINNQAEATTETYQGSVQFDIFQDSRNYWVIVEWRDVQLQDFVSWSELKGGYY